MTVTIPKRSASVRTQPWFLPQDASRQNSRESNQEISPFDGGDRHYAIETVSSATLSDLIVLIQPLLALYSHHHKAGLKRPFLCV